MNIKTVKWLVKYVYKNMRAKGREPSSNKIIGKYLLFNGIRRNKEVLEHMVADENNISDPLDTMELTRFYIDITKHIPGYKYKTDKLTKEHVKFLLDNKFDPDYKRKMMEQEKKEFMEN